MSLKLSSPVPLSLPTITSSVTGGNECNRTNKTCRTDQSIYDNISHSSSTSNCITLKQSSSDDQEKSVERSTINQSTSDIDDDDENDDDDDCYFDPKGIDYSSDFENASYFESSHQLSQKRQQKQQQQQSERHLQQNPSLNELTMQITAKAICHPSGPCRTSQQDRFFHKNDNTSTSSNSTTTLTTQTEKEDEMDEIKSSSTLLLPAITGLEPTTQDNTGTDVYTDISVKVGQLPTLLSPPLPPPYPELFQQLKLAKLVGTPLPSPSWMEVSLRVVPSAVHEVLTTSAFRMYRTALMTYTSIKWTDQYSEYRNNGTGYFSLRHINCHNTAPQIQQHKNHQRQQLQQIDNCSIAHNHSNRSQSSNSAHQIGVVLPHHSACSSGLIDAFANSTSTHAPGTTSGTTALRGIHTMQLEELPRFSSLPWVDRQLVKEWRTYYYSATTDSTDKQDLGAKSKATRNTVRHQHEGISLSPPSNTTSRNGVFLKAKFNDEEIVDSIDDEKSIENTDHLQVESDSEIVDDVEDDFARARTLVPSPIPQSLRPKWDLSDVCYACHRTFGPALLRHHCRWCGHSFCHRDSAHFRKIPQLGYHPDIPERVCTTCADILNEYNLYERIVWRLARCRDFFNFQRYQLEKRKLKENSAALSTNDSDDQHINTNEKNYHVFTPYFEIGADSIEQKLYRVTQAAITMMKSIPLGAQATVAVETADVLRKYGLCGMYTILLRQEFLAAADLLLKALGIDRKAWPLSVHELSAAIFYALAQHRAERGLFPEYEHDLHAINQKQQHHQQTATTMATTALNDDENDKKGLLSADLKTQVKHHAGEVDNNKDIRGAESIHLLRKVTTMYTTPPQPLVAVCDEVPDSVISSLIFYAPLALNFIYLEKEVDIQLLAAQQGWRMVYAYLNHHPSSNSTNSCISKKRRQQQQKEVQTNSSDRNPVSSSGQDITSPTSRFRNNGTNVHDPIHDRPASALFVHDEQKIACLAIRGTSTIHDVVTDIRQQPVPFPEPYPLQHLPARKSATSSVPRDHSVGCDDDQEDWMDMNHPLTSSDKNSIYGGVAVAGMANAAINLYREHIDSLLLFAERGYRIRLTGHSLGSAVASLLGVMIQQDLSRDATIKASNALFKSQFARGATSTSKKQFDTTAATAPAMEIPNNCNNMDNIGGDNDDETTAILRVYAYGTPSCVDDALAEITSSFVVTAVLHDDVVPRLSPTTCRGLLKHLLHIRETWVKQHFPADVKAFTDRAKTVWAPRWRGGFMLPSSNSSQLSSTSSLANFTIATSTTSRLKRFCRKQLQRGKNGLYSVVTTKLINDIPTIDSDKDTKRCHSSVTNINSSMPQTFYSTQYRPFENGQRSFIEDSDHLYDNHIRTNDSLSNQKSVSVIQVDERCQPNYVSNDSNDSDIYDMGITKQTTTNIACTEATMAVNNVDVQLPTLHHSQYLVDYMGRGYDEQVTTIKSGTYICNRTVVDGEEFFDPKDVDFVEINNTSVLLLDQAGEDKDLTKIDRHNSNDDDTFSSCPITPSSYSKQRMKSHHDDKTTHHNSHPSTKEEAVEKISCITNLSDSFDTDTASIIYDMSTKLSLNHNNDQLNKDISVNDEEDSEVVKLDELPLPVMYIPGRIVHIYAHRGVYRASYVPRTFPELRQISMAGNMLQDHKTKSYYDAVLEVRSVRRAPEDPPRWTPFDEDDKCSCCASHFTWASTSNSVAQEARDKHNCRSCGALVCHPCSENRVPIPSIGLMVSVRVCDRCYYNEDLDATNSATATTGEFLYGKHNLDNTDQVFLQEWQEPTFHMTTATNTNKPVRYRAKQSSVVEDLASIVQTSPFHIQM